jgi:GT2 family glycosyltransferase
MTFAPLRNDSLSGMPQRILAVLVLYKLAPEESPAFCTLQALLARDTGMAGRFACILYDNSPSPHSLPATPFPCLYRHDQTNPGLAQPYQYGLDQAMSADVPWLLLLDQDTTITAAYLREALAVTDQIASDGHIVAVVPKLLQGEEMLSPHWPTRHPKPEPLHQKCGLLDQKVKIFNSGSLLRVTALAKIGGFPRSFPLDYLDHVVFHQLQNQGGKVYLMHAGLQHSLSYLQIDLIREFRTSYRTRLIMNAESRYYKQFGTPRERVLYFLRRIRLGLRMIAAAEFRGALSLLRHSLNLSRIAPDSSVPIQKQR